MITLDEAWAWYEAVREQLRGMACLAKYWDQLPWGGPLGVEELLKPMEADPVAAATRLGLLHLDDLAVLVLFSVFEAVVRESVYKKVSAELDRLEHPALRFAGAEALQRIEDGSFFRVLEPFKSEHADLVETVNQVRRYRNWVAHGRRGQPPSGLTPRAAYDRLGDLLAALSLGDRKVEARAP